jgi:uncharacterized protein YceK
MRKFVVVFAIFTCLNGCESVELSQVDSDAPEQAINSPEQAKQLEREHGP